MLKMCFFFFLGSKAQNVFHCYLLWRETMILKLFCGYRVEWFVFKALSFGIWLKF